MSETLRILLVGGGAAGFFAANQAAKTAPGALNEPGRTACAGEEVLRSPDARDGPKPGFFGQAATIGRAAATNHRGPFRCRRCLLVGTR